MHCIPPNRIHFSLCFRPVFVTSPLDIDRWQIVTKPGEMIFSNCIKAENTLYIVTETEYDTLDQEVAAEYIMSFRIRVLPVIGLFFSIGLLNLYIYLPIHITNWLPKRRNRGLVICNPLFHSVSQFCQPVLSRGKEYKCKFLYLLFIITFNWFLQNSINKFKFRKLGRNSCDVICIDNSIFSSLLCNAIVS